MKSFSKKVLAGTTVAAVALAGSIGVLAAQEKPVIATVVKISGIPWFDRMNTGVEAYQEANPDVVASQSGPATADSAQQLQIVNGLKPGAPVRLGGTSLDSGTYTLWTLPGRDRVQLIINRQTGQWGTGYQSRHDITRVNMRVDSVAPVERFTIRFDTIGSRLVMEWGTFRWSVPVEVR